MTSGFGLMEERIARRLETVRGLLMETSPSKSFNYLYFDIETTVDTEIEERWGFPPVLPEEAFITPGSVIKNSIDGVKEELAKHDPLAINQEWLAQVWDAEMSKGEKARKGVLSELSKLMGYRSNVISKFALDPQLARIASVAYAIDDKPVKSIVGGDNEYDLLLVLWDLMAGARYLVGWKIVNFDLRMVFGRSIQQMIRPTRHIDMRKYNNPDVIDLKVAIWGNDVGVKGLKQTAQHFGIDIPAGANVDGSQVALMSTEELLAYNESDTEITRELHLMAAGMYGLDPVEYPSEEDIPF